MMRLIDADKVIERLEKIIKDNSYFVDARYIRGVQEVIKVQPTAYDVDKAIDDFVKAIVDRELSANDDKYCITHYDNYLKVIKELAEQLKEGGNA